MVRLHLVELTQAVQYLGGTSKRFDNTKCKLEYDPESESVTLTPYPSHLSPGVGGAGSRRSRIVPFGQCQFIEPMSPEEEAAANEHDEKREVAFHAEQERQIKLRQEVLAQSAAKSDDAEIAALEKRLQEARAKKNAPKLTRAPVLRTQSGGVKMVKDPHTGKIVEVAEDGSTADATPLPAQEMAQEAAPAPAGEPDAITKLQAELEALKAQLKAQAVAELDPVAKVAAASAEADED